MKSYRQRFIIALTLGWLVLACFNLQAEDKVGQLENRLRNQLSSVREALDGVLGLAVKDLASGQTFYLNENEIFPQASSIKMALLLEVLKQAEENRLRLDEFIDLKPESKVGGGPILNYLGYPSLKISIRDLCVLMVVLSDNTPPICSSTGWEWRQSTIV